MARYSFLQRLEFGRNQRISVQQKQVITLDTELRQDNNAERSSRNATIVTPHSLSKPPEKTISVMRKQW